MNIDSERQLQRALKNLGNKVTVVTLAGLAYLAIAGLYGVAISALWGWFVVPLGFPTIGMAHGVGLALFMHALIWTLPSLHQTKGCSDLTWFIMEFVRPVALYLLGWSVHGAKS